MTFGSVGTPLTAGLHDKDVVAVRSSRGGVLYADVTIKGYASAREQIGSEIDALVQARPAPRGIDATAVNLRNVKPSRSSTASAWTPNGTPIAPRCVSCSVGRFPGAPFPRPAPGARSIPPCG